MKKNAKPTNSLSLHLRLRVVGAEKIALGPGKADLLDLIAESGSLSEAAKRMEMSYMKAWSLVQTMKPLVELTRGGKRGGGATLTPLGRQALALYRQMERDSHTACEGSWQKFQRLAQSSPAGAKSSRTKP
jgi:molybdate transport system regulatory protein